MESYLAQTNILTIAFFGVVTALMGICLYFFRDSVAPYMRFLLPIPPIGVAAYVFVFNMFRNYESGLPNAGGLFREIFTATLTSTAIFLVFSLLLIFMVQLHNQH